MNSNSLALTQPQIPDVLDPRQQHAILHSIGFRLVDFEYVLRRRGKLVKRLLTIYITPKIPTMPYEDGDKFYIPSRLLRVFVEELWMNSSGFNTLSDKDQEKNKSLNAPTGLGLGFTGSTTPLKQLDHEEEISSTTPQDAMLDSIIEQIEIRDKIPLLDLPWGEGPLWTLVDLWEDYDEDLLKKFHHELIEPNYEHDEREPLANWMEIMTSSERENLWYDL